MRTPLSDLMNTIYYARKAVNKYALILILVLAMPSLVLAKKDTLSVEKAFATHLIDLEIKGKGGYQGSCITMQIKKKQSIDTVVVYIEAGRRLDSKDSIQQDILVVQDVFVLLTSDQKKTIDVTGFCCQAHNRAPQTDSKFFVGTLANESLLRLGRFLNSARQLTNDAIQHAIWCVSDNNELSSVSDDGSEIVTKLRHFIATLKSIELPWYNTFYKKESDRLFSGIPERITGNIPYYIDDFSMVVANIRDANGTIVKSFQIGNSVARGDYVFNMDWNVANINKGKYKVYLYDDGRKLVEMLIELK